MCYSVEKEQEGKMGSVTLDFTPRPPQEWHKLLAKVYRPNALQSMPFLHAARRIDRLAPRFALIVVDGTPQGVVTLQEVRLGPIHIINIFRGPLWFSSKPEESWLQGFAEELDRLYPRRFLRRRRWLPEWPATESAKAMLNKAGFRKNDQTYETIWLDLRDAEKTLRQRLNGKWRNRLVKAESAGLTVSVDQTGKTLAQFLDCYVLDKKAKNYKGRSREFLATEISGAMQLKEAQILWATDASATPVAAILVVQHGHAATYRIGWTTDEGRNTQAHSLLLWQACLFLKKKGIHYFDLGGVEPGTAEGMTAFKRGLGGEPLQLLGVYS
jgi:hypothetical protein